MSFSPVHQPNQPTNFIHSLLFNLIYLIYFYFNIGYEFDSLINKEKLED